MRTARTRSCFGLEGPRAGVVVYSRSLAFIRGWNVFFSARLPNVLGEDAKGWRAGVLELAGLDRPNKASQEEPGESQAGENEDEDDGHS